MFNQELNFQNIFKQESSEIANTYFLPSKNQARFSNFFFIPSKNQARQQLLQKAPSRSRQEFWLQKAWDQEFQASLALLWFERIVVSAKSHLNSAEGRGGPQLCFLTLHLINCELGAHADGLSGRNNIFLNFNITINPSSCLPATLLDKNGIT